MDRRSFLLAIPFIAVARKIIKPEPSVLEIWGPVGPNGPIGDTGFQVTIKEFTITDPDMIAWLNAHPRNAANTKNNPFFISK